MALSRESEFPPTEELNGAEGNLTYPDSLWIYGDKRFISHASSGSSV